MNLASETDVIYIDDFKKMWERTSVSVEELLCRSRIPWDEEKDNEINYFGIIARNKIIVIGTSLEMPPLEIVFMSNIIINLKLRKYIKHRCLENYDKIPVLEDVMKLFWHVPRYIVVRDGFHHILKEEPYI